MRMFNNAAMILVLGLVVSPTLAAGGIDDLVKNCNDCHGDKGISKDADIPIIGGLSEFFIDETMWIYKDKARPCIDEEYQSGPKKGEVDDMCSIAADLSEEQIAELAAHYSALPFVPAEQPFDAANVAAGAEIHERHCEKCHAFAGSDPMDDSGLLAGQWTEYLRNSIEHFRAGERETDEKMLEKLEMLSESEIEALLDFYASETGKYK